MLHLQGIPISPGYADGIAVVYDYEIERRLELPQHAISHLEIETECRRLDDALETFFRNLKHFERTTFNDRMPVDSTALSSVHMAMISVHTAMANEIAALVKQHIGREIVNVEQALDAVIFQEQFV